MTIENRIPIFFSDSHSRQFRIALPRLGFILAVLLASLNLANAQTGVDYRFLEVLDNAGNPVADAQIETNTSRQKTDEKGSVKLAIYFGDANTKTLKVSKADCYPYEDPAPPFSAHAEYLLRGEIPAFDFHAPIRIELLKIPMGRAEQKAIEIKQRERELIAAAKKGDGANVQALLQAGVDAGAKDGNGIPVILWAAFGGNADAINALLAAGARAGPNALRYYLSYTWRIDREVVRSLLKEVPDIDAADNQGQTLLILAAASPASQSADAVEILLQHRIAIDAKDSEGRTPLVAAMLNGSENVEKTKLLLAMRPNVNATDNHKRTALILAAIYRPPEILKMLIDAGSDINQRDDEGETALIASLGRGFISDPAPTAAKVRLLLAAGADVNIQDNDGQTALGRARKSGNEKLIKLLEGLDQ